MFDPGPPISTTAESSASHSELPWAFTDCSADTLVILISHMLNLLIQHNDQVVLTPDALTRFHSRAPPGISVIEYLRRIVKYTNMEKIPLLSLLAYIDTTCQHLPTFTLSSLTVHRFLIAGICAGSKAQCDVFCTNAHYAKVGGIKTQELNGLEREFLKVTGWDLCCNADLLQRYYTSLIRSHGGYTQAAAPEVPPFASFPHSNSKPPSPAQSESEAEEEDGDDEMVGHGESSRPESEYGSAEEDVKAQALDVRDMAVDRRGAAPSISTSRNRPKQKPPDKLGTTTMELDPPDDSPFSAATSSSIPSSSLSSIRGLRPPARGRTTSLSFSDPKLAEPRVDRSTASGEGAPWSAGMSQADGGEHEQPHDHHGGHLLRKLVGGIFRRKSHSDRPQAVLEDERRPHSLLTSKPLAGALHRSKAPAPTLVDPASIPPPAPRQEARSASVRSSVNAHLPGPGQVKPVTPRVRMRDESSVDSLRGERVGLAPTVGMGAIEGAIDDIREERRARLE